MKNASFYFKHFIALSFFLLLFTLNGFSQKESKVISSAGFDEALFEAQQWRCIGPFRGGRSAAVTGVPGKPNLFYMGATGGGVWKTKDGGQSWDNISDGFFGGSIGAVAVSEYDPNVIYVGGGEVTVRGNVSYGYGMWRSTDAGKTWKHIGLENSKHIPRIRIHPRNPDLVYAAVLGDLFKPSEDRGVYRSMDGGKTWDKVLFVNEDAGAVDLLLDPNNPRILYASTWRVRRTPYSLSSGGEGSALWKSTDSGTTWTNISDKPGLPEGVWGINGVAISPLNSDRIWAIIENENGGVFRSDDGGENWNKVNDSRDLRQRAWYYSRIYADTKDEDIVYVVNVRYHKSKDGGKTFTAYNAPHGDHHDLWIAPEDNQRMIIADDGGAQVSFDGGENWSTDHNQPTAQFYRVVTDEHFPFRIYGAQQDNSTVRIAHRTTGNSIEERDWESTAGGESAHIAVSPENNDIVFGGSYGGFLTRYNHQTQQSQGINVWPDNPMGYGAEGMKYRFQWNFPIFFSPHNPQKLYAGSNHLHVTYDGGQSWEIISPDLTRNDSTKLVSSGGPITQDNTSVEYYCTIFAAIESPYEQDLLWTGSDDGLVHVSRDGGKNWENVTPKNMPEWMMINSIDADPFTKGGAYVAGTRYKSGDYTPYLYKTEDYGKSWRLITKGIDKQHFTRVLRADPHRKGLLYAGTETGMYISFDDGQNWQPFQLNLPIVPITDLTIKDDHLIAATQGRSFWMIDDLTVLHQLSDQDKSTAIKLFQPRPSIRMQGGQNKKNVHEGLNHPGGVMVNFYLKETPADSVEVSLTFLEMEGDTIRTFSNKAKEKKDQLELKKGGNMFRWDMKYPDAKKFEGMILWWASMSGPLALPGFYKVVLNVGGEIQEQTFEIIKNPLSEASSDDLLAQFTFLKELGDKVTEAHKAIIDIRDIKEQLSNITKRLKDEADKKEIIDQAKEIEKELSKVEETLYQTKNRSGQDPLNFPIRLTNKLAHLNSLNSMGDFRPTEQSYDVKNELTREIDDQIREYERIRNEALPGFNELIKKLGINAVLLNESI
ncbi:MAG: glycosyl hydrolase [Saprospiraceae bacterium]|nr:glycosyl hydrolase [Saprospiraceae bacterium]MCB9322790.1 glycosyl hydrolase [Lewinellaceae bacterium]